jgi:hypothetical protein
MMLVWLFLLLVAVSVVTTAIVLCLPYWRSPERAWRNKVMSACRAAQRQVQWEQAQIQRLSTERAAREQALGQEAFERFLATVTVAELDAYPGIGPATVDRLRQAGYGNLARLRNGWIGIPGIGAKRRADVTDAVRQLTRETEKRFRAGTSPESNELEIRLQELRKTYAQLESRGRARAEGAGEVVRQLDGAVALARQISLWKYFWHDSHVVVPAELLQRPLPDLVSRLAAAEQRAIKTLRESHGVAACTIAKTPVASQPPSPGLDSRASLEIDPNVRLTPDLIRRQYHLLSGRLAPDKVESMGPEFVAMARSKQAAVRAAAEALIAPLGAALDLPGEQAAPAELRQNPDLDAVFGA